MPQAFTQEWLAEESRVLWFQQDAVPNTLSTLQPKHNQMCQLEKNNNFIASMTSQKVRHIYNPKPTEYLLTVLWSHMKCRSKQNPEPAPREDSNRKPPPHKAKTPKSYTSVSRWTRTKPPHSLHPGDYKANAYTQHWQWVEGGKNPLLELVAVSQL